MTTIAYDGITLAGDLLCTRGNTPTRVGSKVFRLDNAHRRGPALVGAAGASIDCAAFIRRLREVRVACGGWSRVLTDSVTVRHGLTGVFLDPPYTKGAMDYAAGGVGGKLAGEVREWCLKNGTNKCLRIVLCGHAGEHDELLAHGWGLRTWEARKGYASTDEALENSASETLWCSPHCVPERAVQDALF